MTLRTIHTRRIEVVKLVGGRLAIGMAGEVVKPLALKAVR